MASNPRFEEIGPSPSSTFLASSSTSYDSWGNVKYTKDNVGHERYFSYANTDSQNTFGVSGFSDSFYSTNSVVGTNVYGALVGEAEFQNGSGSAAMETYFKYDSSGNLVEQKQLHGGSWLLTNSTHDGYGNRLSMVDASFTTYYSYDARNRLTNETKYVAGTKYSFLYSYDKVGNIVSMTYPTGTPSPSPTTR